ncbi:hypothetical protein EmuJ_000994700 [Echinococcus multilocularis]|uniref:KRAB A domain containing protein n=1 Tax=Echinococcus multilocularis TaxID=6211 RepID=A0A068YCD7_ECHMU|nr:hypothetical protein EmuJ_000994700 [Echinococcus multilocularis]
MLFRTINLIEYCRTRVILNKRFLFTRKYTMHQNYYEFLSEEMVAIAIMDPLPPIKRENGYILVVVDNVKKAAEAERAKTQDAEEIVSVFFTHWICKQQISEMAHNIQKNK